MSYKLEKAERQLRDGKIEKAKRNLALHYKGVQVGTTSELCTECNVLDGEDSDCNTCGGVGTIKVPVYPTDEEVQVKVDAYLKESDKYKAYILLQIEELEKQCVRPAREIAIALMNNKQNQYAEDKLKQIEIEIEELRGQL